MFDKLYSSFERHITLADEEWELCRDSFKPKRLLKRQYLLQQDDVCRHLTFVAKGSLVSFTVDQRGNQHVLRFAFEGWWMGDLQSFITQQPSNMNIEALEDCELLILDKAKHEMLLDEIPAYERFHRIIMENGYIALKRRLMNALGLSAEEKYARLLKDNPEFLHRVPLNLVASYLGISPETLSRVRANFAG